MQTKWKHQSRRWVELWRRSEKEVYGGEKKGDQVAAVGCSGAAWLQWVTRFFTIAESVFPGHREGGCDCLELHKGACHGCADDKLFMFDCIRINVESYLSAIGERYGEDTLPFLANRSIILPTASSSWNQKFASISNLIEEIYITF